MATNPYFTQYHTQRFSFIGSPQQRDSGYTKDQRFVNVYPELIKSPISDGKKYYLKKRPGMNSTAFQALPTGITQGFFYWPANNAYYYAIAGTLYQNTTALFSLTSATNNVGFTEFRVTTDELFVCDGISGWVVQAGGSFVKITDVNFPSPHITTPVFLDGYIFLAGSGGQRIYNSTLADPTTWPSDGFIDAEMFPDNLVALAKVQNYIAAVGTGSIEWLYDNANATGSPLQRNAPAVSQFGCPAYQSINQTERELILIGQTGNGGRTIWVIDGFQPTEIANEPVREALDAEGTEISLASANTIQCAGHKWYILNLLLSNRTFVYDFEEKMWHEWTSGFGQSIFNFKYAADNGSGVPVWIGYNGGNSYIMSANDYTDLLGQTINCQIFTVKIDFDTIMRKRFYRLSIIGDSPLGDSTVPMTVQWSDDDYNTWSQPYTLNLNATYPTITQMGYSRRRAFWFTYQQPYPLRLESFEVDVIQEVRR